MTDGIIKGTGNSRYLRAPANVGTLYPTWAAALDALAAGTFPIDLNGINPTGWETVGDKLDKATLLTDTLCTALGLATTATPTQAMDKLRTLTSTAQSTANTAQSNRMKISAGAYTGTGAESQKISLSFTPKAVLVLARGFNLISNNWAYGGLAVTGYPAGMSPSTYVEIVTNGFNVFYNSARYISTNGSSSLYHYMAIGGGASS